MSDLFTEEYREGFRRGKRVIEAMQEKLTIDGKSASEILRYMADIQEKIEGMNSEEVKEYVSDLEAEWL